MKIKINISESGIVKVLSKNINIKAINPNIIMLIKGLEGNERLNLSKLINSIEIEKTRAILDMFDPSAFPTANIVWFRRADSIETKISGADVAIPIKKKLA
jgi:hypothetical protein